MFLSLSKKNMTHSARPNIQLETTDIISSTRATSKQVVHWTPIIT